MFYIAVIVGGAFLIALGNLAAHALAPQAILPVCLSVALGVVAIMAEDGLSALLLRRLLPSRLFSAERRIFAVGKREKRFYDALKIKKWKGLVPDLGLFTSFSKSELKSKDDAAYLGRFLMESHYGVVIHLANGLLGFVIAFIPFCASPSVWVPIFLVNLMLSLLPVFVLRYTCYTLGRLYARSKKRSQA